MQSPQSQKSMLLKLLFMKLYEVPWYSLVFKIVLKKHQYKGFQDRLSLIVTNPNPKKNPDLFSSFFLSWLPSLKCSVRI